MKARDFKKLEEALGHRFRRSKLLEQALTHSSHAHELEARSLSSGVRDNEQLEFLGDAVLGFVTSQELFQRFPEYQEGQLSKLRAHLVSAKHLVQVAGELQLGEYLRNAMARTLFARIGYLFARNAFAAVKDKMDPRNVNGGVFLGLNGVVVEVDEASGKALAIERINLLCG